MEHAFIIILVALLQYAWFLVRTGFLRGKYHVSAPKTSGDETWERVYRVQLNTLEQLILFIPGVLIFTWYTGPAWVWLPGALFIIGRQWYSHAYITHPAKRAPGMILSILSNLVLIIGGLICAIISLVS